MGYGKSILHDCRAVQIKRKRAKKNRLLAHLMGWYRVIPDDIIRIITDGMSWKSPSGEVFEELPNLLKEVERYRAFPDPLER